MDKHSMVYPLMNYYSSIKRSKLLMYATTWMNLENLMLSDSTMSEIGKSTK
jgi:hypothetical protein